MKTSKNNQYSELLDMLNAINPEFSSGVVEEDFTEEGIAQATNSDKILFRKQDNSKLKYFIVPRKSGHLDWVIKTMGGIDKFFIFDRQWDAEETYGVLLAWM